MKEPQINQTADVRNIYIGDRIRNAAKIGGLTGELFSSAADEIERLRAENDRLWAWVNDAEQHLKRSSDLHAEMLRERQDA